MEEKGLLNSLVGEYLSSLGTKWAEKFKKETKAAPLPKGSPGLKELVKYYPQKRKIEETNGSTPSKKSKKVSSYENYEKNKRYLIHVVG